ncbi:hypothetical protein [Acutalibacter muris]|nr:hypothetical protein [Acutalibacter muris]
MSALKFYGCYLSWLGASEPVPLQSLFDFPFTNRDIYEEDKVVNRLFYLVPDLSGTVPRCFFFFEENVFSKDKVGDLLLQTSAFHTFES